MQTALVVFIGSCYHNSLTNANIFKQLESNLNNGGCSLTVERTVVVRVARVRLPPSACKVNDKEGGRNSPY